MPARGRRSTVNSRYCPDCFRFVRVSNITGRYESHGFYEISRGQVVRGVCRGSLAYWKGWSSMYGLWSTEGRFVITPARKRRRHERGTGYNWPRGARG